jgi:hypothetical protein
VYSGCETWNCFGRSGHRLFNNCFLYVFGGGSEPSPPFQPSPCHKCVRAHPCQRAASLLQSHQDQAPDTAASNSLNY